MDIDVRNRVNSLVLSPKKCLYPVFEAVVNAVQAIDEKKRTDGKIEVIIHRDQKQKMMDGTWTLPCLRFYDPRQWRGVQ